MGNVDGSRQVPLSVWHLGGRHRSRGMKFRSLGVAFRDWVDWPDRAFWVGKPGLTAARTLPIRDSPEKG